MAYQCFLVAIMVFGADPMQPSLTVPRDGDGLSPLLQHPAMLLHPPVVFLGYAGCAIPFALAAAALLSGRLDAAWVREARPWAFFAWAVLGIGILVGAYWAYEELGWGGYWSWDPVENGSLIPWLAATAMIHAAMVYRQRGALKRTTLLLAVATFAACNFAAFLTRSGIFSSLHAFSQSPIGWMFLLLIVALAVGAAVLLVRRRVAMAPDNPISGLLAKEGVAAASVFVLILLAAAVFFGTASLPLSQVFFPHKVLVGAGFYNGVLIPTGLLLLAAMAAAPLLRWGAPPETRQVKALADCGGRRRDRGRPGVARRPAASAGDGRRRPGGRDGDCPGGVVDAGCPPACHRRRSGSTCCESSATGGERTPATRCTWGWPAWPSAWPGLRWARNSTRQRSRKGESIHWAGRDVRFVRLLQQRLPEKLVVQAELEVTADGAAPYTLLPAQEYYFLQNQWSTEVAIHSTWSGDFYTILHGGEGQDRIRLTLVENPMMRWMWLAGWIVVAGARAVVLAGRKTSPPKTAERSGGSRRRSRPKLRRRTAA